MLRPEHVAKYLQAKLGFALGTFWTLFPCRLMHAARHKFDDAWAARPRYTLVNTFQHVAGLALGDVLG